jgi:hypothetical protein
VADSLVLPVPETLSAVYLVPSGLSGQAAKAETASVIAAHVPDPVGTVARKMLGAGAVSVTSAGPQVLPSGFASLQRQLGVPEELTAGVADAAAFAAFTVSWPPGWPPVHEAVARACAAALAASAGVPLLDSFSPVVLAPRQAIQSLPGEDYEIRIADWVLTLTSAGAPGLRVTTRGLGRFGLPELQAHGVPPHLGPSWERLMLGLSSRLLTLWIDESLPERGGAVAEVPAEIEVGEDDVAYAYGEDSGGSGRAVLARLVYDPATDSHPMSFLTLRPPGDFPGPASEFMTDACTALFGVETELR